MEKTLAMSNCDCDTLKAKATVFHKEFNNIPLFDTVNFLQQNFDTLPRNVKELLWFRDLENAIPTQFTSFWSSGRFTRIKDSDTTDKVVVSREKAFVDRYFNRQNIELAIELGPNMDLWAYHYFIFRKIENCYVVTHSYFRHARFTFKSYAIINETQLKSLFEILEKANVEDFVGQTANGYAGYFVDNRNKRNLFIDFQSKKNVRENQNNYSEEIQNLFEYLDKKIAWNVTFPQ